jgi:hypothetical protein
VTTAHVDHIVAVVSTAAAHDDSKDDEAGHYSDGDPDLGAVVAHFCDVGEMDLS